MEKNPDVHLTYGNSLRLGPACRAPTVSLEDHDAPYQVIAGRDLLERLCREARCFISSPTVVVRTAAQKRVGYYRAELVHTDDYEMWMRFACVGSAAEIQTVQAVQRSHPQNRSASVKNVYFWDLYYEAALESFFANEGALVDRSSRLQRIARRALSERAYWGSIANLLRGDVRLSLALLRFAVTRNPRTLLIPPLGYLLRRWNGTKKRSAKSSRKQHGSSVHASVDCRVRFRRGREQD